jgi:signal transduction histidine kinase
MVAIAPQLQQAGIEIEEALEAHRDTVLGNAEHLEGVFLNLFLNAAEAMSGGGRISVSTEAHHEPKGGAGWIEVRVRDQGPGVPTELTERIFEPFFSTKGDGTGFGLSVALTTVADHGGTLRLEESAGEGGGAVFVMELPLVAGGEGEAGR